MTNARESSESSRGSKFLSWLLRHGAAEQGLALDGAGWIEIDRVAEASGLSAEEILRLVEQDSKRRYQVEGGRIRACQGHTPASGVNADDLEASWRPYLSDEPIWHGTNIEAVPEIARSGILSMERTHVHSAPRADSNVGKRASVHVLLEIDPAKVRRAGIRLFESPNGVILARSIPPEAIVNVIPMTKRASQDAEALRARFAGRGGAIRPDPGE